jgi:hypothetical protein
MALTGKEENGAKRKFVATFDNGTLEQLDELRVFFKQTDNTELLKLTISVLQRAKDTQPRPTGQ